MTGQLRTLHTIGGFEGSHKQLWPLTPSYQGVRAGSLVWSGAKSHLHAAPPWPEAPRTHPFVYQDQNRWMELNLRTFQLILVFPEHSYPRETQHCLDVFIQATACWLLIAESEWLPISRQILTYSPSCSVSAICQSQTNEKHFCLAVGHAGRGYDVSEADLSGPAPFLFLYVNFLKLVGWEI